MIYIDDQAGGRPNKTNVPRELMTGLEKLGLPVQLRRLKSGDIMFVGRGEKGAPLVVGIEFKKLPDLITSLNSGRLTSVGEPGSKNEGQIPRMLRTFDRSILIIEGDWQRELDGSVSTWKSSGKRGRLKGSPNAMELRRRVRSIEVVTGIEVEWAPTRRWTLDFLYTEYRFWTDKDLDSHKSHLAVHVATPSFSMSDFRASLQVLLPGIGFAASKVVEQLVPCLDEEGKPSGSMRRLCLLTFKEWATLELPDRHGGIKRLGEKRATAIMKRLDTWRN